MSCSKQTTGKARVKKALSFAVAAMNTANALVPVTIPYINIAQAMQQELAHSQTAKASVEVMHLGTQLLDQIIFNKAEAFTSPVEDGEVVSEEIVSTGTQHILNGGSTLRGILNTRGQQIISSGGLAIDTAINVRGEQLVVGGGSALYTKINGGGAQTVSAGGTAMSTTLNSGGTQVVSSGGTALNVLQNSGGNIVADVVSGNNIEVNGTNDNGTFSLLNGTATNFILYSDGSQRLSSGGVTVSTSVNNGAMQSVHAGGTALHTTVNSGGLQSISDGGTAMSTAVNSGSLQSISDGGTAMSTTINNGGSQSVGSGGTTINTTINNGGFHNVGIGGTALNTVQTSGAHMITSVFAGNSAIVTGTNEKGAFSLANGTASNFIIYSGGWQTIEPSGSSLDILQHSGGNVVTYVYANNTAKITGTNENGAFTLSNGTATNFILYNSGLQLLANGGTALNTIIHSGGTQVFINGGTAMNTTIESGGALNMYNNAGSALDTMQNSGGNVDVAVADGYNIYVTGTNENGEFSLANGTANNFIIYSGGLHTVSNGGTSLNLTQSSGAAMNTFVEAGATTKIIGTNQSGSFVLSNGVANNFILYSGAMQGVFLGGTSLNITQNSGGNIGTIAAAGNNIQITGTNEKGSFSLLNGTASNFIVYSSGMLTVSGGGVAINTTLDARFEVQGGGTDISTTINSNGHQHVMDGGTTLSATMNGGYMDVNGGTTFAVTMNDNALQILRNYAIAENTTINGGRQSLDFFTTATSTSIVGSGLQFVAYGKAIATSIAQGGQQTIYGGTATSTTINSGGTQNVAGGSAVSTTINNGGMQFIHSGAKVIESVVNSGGLMYGQSNGTLTDTTLNSGGTLVLFKGAKVLGSLDNSGYIDASKFNNGSINALLGTDGTVLFNAAPYVPVTYGKSLSLGSLDGSQTFDISADLKNNTADNIVITGDVSGTHYIKVTKEASPGSVLAALVGPATVATVLGTDTSQFLGVQSAIDGVKILPNIVHNGNLWQIDRYTITGVSDLAKVASASADMAYAALISNDQILKNRTGDVKDSLKESGVWAKINGGEVAINSNSMKYGSVQGGYDKVHTSANGISVTGIMLEHFDGSVGYIANASGKLKNSRVGLYHTWFGNSGHYYDIVLKTGRMRNEVNVYESSLVKGAYNSWNNSISLEYGHKQPLKNGYYINPLAKLSLGRINSANYITNSDTHIQQDAINSVLGKVGIGIGHSTERSKWYINALVAHEFTAKSKVTTGQGAFASTLENSLRATSLEVSLGTSVKVSHAGLFYTNLSKSFGGKVINKWQLQMGYRYNF